VSEESEWVSEWREWVSGESEWVSEESEWVSEWVSEWREWVSEESEWVNGFNIVLISAIYSYVWQWLSDLLCNWSRLKLDFRCQHTEVPWLKRESQITFNEDKLHEQIWVITTDIHTVEYIICATLPSVKFFTIILCILNFLKIH